MKYFFIYSAGGGAGDWNGIKRIWKTSMPEVLKENVLLKFGDVFFNHASNSSPIRGGLWRNTNNIRKWLADAVNDDYVTRKAKILLDSGTSKLINTVNTQNSNFSAEEVIYKFRGIIDNNDILSKYAEVIIESNIDEAVTLDAPNPFKIRTQSENIRTSIFEESHDYLHIALNVEYCNKLYDLLDGQEKMLTTFNGLWDQQSLQTFLKGLKYKPNKIAIGGLTRASVSIFCSQLVMIDKVINLNAMKRVHFLGCGGIDKANLIKACGFNSDNHSVDNSTPYNRAIDGNLTGTTQSGYFDYSTRKIIRINPTNRSKILSLHRRAQNKVFSNDQMEDIIDSIMEHQSKNSSLETYNNRAKLIIHNHDVFRQNAL